jgi:hypothetical protein
MMKISIEYLLAHTSETVEVGRVPCVGECVSAATLDEACFEVKDVIHLTNPVKNGVVAIVRVK